MYAAINMETWVLIRRDFGALRAEILRGAQQTSALRAVTMTLRPYCKNFESLIVM